MGTVYALLIVRTKTNRRWTMKFTFLMITTIFLFHFSIASVESDLMRKPSSVLPVSALASVSDVLSRAERENANRTPSASSLRPSSQGVDRLSERIASASTCPSYYGGQVIPAAIFNLPYQTYQSESRREGRMRTKAVGAFVRINAKNSLNPRINLKSNNINNSNSQSPEVRFYHPNFIAEKGTEFMGTAVVVGPCMVVTTKHQALVEYSGSPSDKKAVDNFLDNYTPSISLGDGSSNGNDFESNYELSKVHCGSVLPSDIQKNDTMNSNEDYCYWRVNNCSNQSDDAPGNKYGHYTLDATNPEEIRKNNIIQLMSSVSLPLFKAFNQNREYIGFSGNNWVSDLAQISRDSTYLDDVGLFTTAQSQNGDSGGSFLWEDSEGIPYLLGITSRVSNTIPGVVKDITSPNYYTKSASIYYQFYDKFLKDNNLDLLTIMKDKGVNICFNQSEKHSDCDLYFVDDSNGLVRAYQNGQTIYQSNPGTIQDPPIFDL